MATSGDELLADAQAELWRAAQSLPPPGPDRRSTAQALFQGQLAAWPDLARATRQALNALPFDRDHHLRYAVVLTTLERVEKGNRPPAVDVDPHFSRAAQLTGAAGDAMMRSRALSQAGDSGPQDQLLAHVETAARLTAAYAEQTTTSSSSSEAAGRWLRLAQEAKRAVSTPVGDRTSPVTAAPIPRADEVSLTASLERWYRAARTTSSPGSAAPSMDLPLVAAGLSTLHSAADATRLGQADQTDAATRWRAAGAAWPSAIRIPGPVASELRAATSALRVDLVSFVEGYRRGSHTQADVAALSHYASRPVIRSLALGYREAIEEALASSLPVIAARRLAETSRPVPDDLAEVVRRGGWVPLPSGSEPAHAIHRTADAAAQASYYNRSDPASTLINDPEARAARLSSSAGLARTTRDTLQAPGLSAGEPPASAPTDRDRARRTHRDR